MNETRLSPEDPKLTAFALGQLEGDERAAVEAALRHDPEARAFVEQTRAFATELENVLAHEPEPAAAAKPKDTAEYPKTAKVLRFPQLYFVIGGLAAACFAVVLALRTPKQSGPQQVRYYRELRLTPPSTELSKTDPAAADSEVVASVDSAKVGAIAALAPEAPAPKLELALPPPPTPKVEISTVDEKGGLLAQVQQSLPAVMPSPKVVPRDLSRTITVPGSLGTETLGQSYAGIQAPVANRSRATYKAAIGLKEEAKLAEGSSLRAESFAMTYGSHQGAKSVGGTPDDIALSTPSRQTARRFTWGSARSRGQMPSVADSHNESYAYHHDNGFVTPQQEAFSTFAFDVSTASYANVRRMLETGQLPPADAVRIEELVNYFPYRYAAPAAGAPAPFAAALEVSAAPWAAGHRLVRVGLKARDVVKADRPAANLVFLLDVSGSMAEPNKLPLVKESMRLMLKSLRPDDRVAIVTYAGNSGLALPSTPVAKAREIEAALDQLSAGGSTNGGMGIQLAYDIAKANLVAGGINRVVLCTDGDFNVGTVGQGDLTRLIEEKAKSGVGLTALGFGMGNLKDSTLELLANKGKGNHGYIDTKAEAEKLLAQEINGTLMTIAKDVKVQVDFNPAKVASYRLIGYENRILAARDFKDDKVDGGAVGAGHTVTALYEIVPVGSKDAAEVAPAINRSKYRTVESVVAANTAAVNELLTVKIRYKEPNSTASQEVEFPLIDTGTSFANATTDFRFAAAVAEFGMILRDSPHRGTATLGDVVAWAAGATTRAEDDPNGYRAEFIHLAQRAQQLQH